MTRTDLPLPNLTVQQLEYLAAVSDAPTWADAAAHVGVTPSALSQGLAELERRVGLPLFERHGRRRILRTDAEPVAAHARQVLASTKDLARWASRQRSGTIGVVRVGMIDTAVVHHYRRHLRRHRETTPDVDLQLRVAPSASLVDAMERAELDVAVCIASPTERPTLLARPARRDALVVVAPMGVDAQSSERWGPWVTFPETSHTRALARREILTRGHRFDVVAESNQPEVLLELTNLGIGWSVLPSTSTTRLDPSRLAPLVDRKLVIYTRRDARPSEATDRFVASLGQTGS